MIIWKLFHGKMKKNLEQCNLEKMYLELANMGLTYTNILISFFISFIQTCYSKTKNVQQTSSNALPTFNCKNILITVILNSQISFEDYKYTNSFQSYLTSFFKTNFYNSW